jgi:hypothetical protein
MTRFAAAICFCFCLCPFVPLPGHAQSDAGATDRCFPWQEFRNGVCAAKTALPAPPPLPAMPSGCAGGSRDAAGQCVCPANTHLEAGGNCVADAAPPPAPSRTTAIACDGGTLADGRCACPAGFSLMPAGDDPAQGGTCVRRGAENCLGGEMTVAGICLCSGQVTMSGQVYDLEYAKGKCVPKLCPREGPCVTTAVGPSGSDGEAGGRTSSPKASAEESERRPGCGRGMVQTRSGCVRVRHRYQAIEPGDYLRRYRPPGYASPLQ